MTASAARLEFLALVDDRIMRAVSGLLQDGSGDLTFRRLSQAAGVPERTLFRYYPTKAELMAAFWKWMNARIEVPEQPSSPTELVEQIPELFAAFEADERLVRAMLHDPNGREVRLAHAPERRKRLRVALEDLLSDLEPGLQEKLLASVQILASAAGWESMKDNWNLTSDQAASAAGWAVGALLGAAGGRGSPREHKRPERRA